MYVCAERKNKLVNYGDKYFAQIAQFTIKYGSTPYYNWHMFCVNGHLKKSIGVPLHLITVGIKKELTLFLHFLPFADIQQVDLYIGR